MQQTFQTLNVTIKDYVAWITLNRPEIHNAFNETMIGELLSLYRQLGQSNNCRIVVITGAGKSFCAGADLKWMAGVVDYSFEQNLTESMQLAELFYTVYSLDKPTIAMVNGAAIGGGAGLVAVNDFVYITEAAKFSFSEVKLGLVPACISPYVIRKVGENYSRTLFLTGERIDAQRALEIGMANKISSHEQLKQDVEKLIDLLMTNGPRAMAICKHLLEQVPQLSLEDAKRFTAEVIANLRISGEGQEGMKAFFSKRKPYWNKKC
ncbi:enoyl-CoA hydratase/isomerase family protein [candidate division KSB1 bacterium]|nr:enoyl-CoA hydratase/isomerase family protein [candidate division KSB1 bacterium]